MKITLNGIQLTDAQVERDFRDRKGRFARAKFKIRRFFVQLFFWIIIISIPYGTYQIGAYVNDLKHVEAEVIAQDTLATKIDQLKENVLDQVKKGESMNLKEKDALITFDPSKNSNKDIASIGLFQFKIGTVIGYYKQLYGKTITPLEAVQIALDEQQARQLAKDIIFKDDGIGNWYNTMNRYGLREQIKIIKLLESK